MKKIIVAPPADFGRVPQAELDRIYDDVHKSLLEARSRLAAAVVSGEGAAEGDPARGEASAASAPATNRGGKSVIAARLVLEDGQVMEIPARRVGDGDNAFLDWVNFTTDETDFMFGKSCLSDEEVIDRVSFKCDEIFGFGVTEQREGGANFYHRSYVLGDGYGLVCHGGQRSTVLVMLSGEGCAAAREGWELRLHEFLSVRCGTRAKLTRLDLAHDIYDGVAYNVDKADADFDAGLFNCGGRDPNHETRGNWKKPTGKGRTLYIGSRDNGKFLRVYEKGRQLGDKNSNWNRVECEMKAVNRIIPFDALLRPGEYLAASYPALAWICQRQERILTTQKKTEIVYSAGVEWLGRQVGAWINVLVEVEGSAEKAIAKIIKTGAIPKRLRVPDWRSVGKCCHDHQRPQPKFEQFFAASMA